MLAEVPDGDPPRADVAVVSLSGFQTDAVVGKVAFAISTGTSRETFGSANLSTSGDAGTIAVSAFDGGEITVAIIGAKMQSASDGGGGSGTFTLDIEFDRQRLR